MTHIEPFGLFLMLCPIFGLLVFLSIQSITLRHEIDKIKNEFGIS